MLHTLRSNSNKIELPYLFLSQKYLQPLNTIKSTTGQNFYLSLQNVQLVARWLSALEKKIEQYSAGNNDSHIVPQGILQASINIRNKLPTSKLDNLHKALDNFTQVCSL